jgi:hypothetical protein
MKPVTRRQIIHDYLQTLELLKSPVRIDWELPCSKRDIQRAIREELLENPASDIRDQLEVAYAETESFISVEEYELLSRFKETCSVAERLARSGTPGDILASSRLMERICGEKAVKVLERISQAMRRQLDSIRSVHMMASSIGLKNASPT